MSNQLDDRLIEVGIQIGDNIQFFGEGFYITSQGTKYGNQNPNECQVRIDNLTAEHRNQILTETSLFNPNRTETLLILKAGRKSYGMSQIFLGNIMTSGVTQPPDIGIIMNAVTTGALRIETVSVSMPDRTSLQTISQTAANQMGLTLNFVADDKQVANYSYTGSMMTQIDKIAATGNVDVYVDDTTLVVKNKGQTLPGEVKEINLNTGMIGIPELTEQGVRVKFLLDNDTKIGSQVRITSKLNPSLNGIYVIYNLHFDISTRDTAFYYIAECGRNLDQ